jgi:type II secretory pathway pseudopilin PulG
MIIATSRMRVPSANRDLTSNGQDFPSAARALRGMTLLEMTLVLLVLFSLVSILFVGAAAWKRGAERSLCVVNIQTVQKSVRSYANMYGFDPGANAPDLRSKIIGPGCYVERAPVCRSPGVYSFGAAYGENTIPPIGTLYMECSLAATKKHAPESYADW